MNRVALNSTANSSGPSASASSVVTDTNSAFSGRPRMQRSSSINNEGSMRLPASPMSFSSNVSNPAVMDCSSTGQQGASSATSQPKRQEQGSLSNLNSQKKPRLDTALDDILHQQQYVQQLLHRQGSFQLQGQHSPQVQAMVQRQRLAQQQQKQQQVLQSLSQMQWAPMHQQPHQLRPGYLQQQAIQPPIPIEPQINKGLCARRLRQYMYHQHHRPPDNSILYWRKFVAEYFAPQAKKRWCLSSYDNVGSQALGIFRQASMDQWKCDVCGSKSGKGFEAKFQVLPRLNQIKFDRGVIDELLFLDMPREFRLSLGMMLLEYEKAVQEIIYEEQRVVREGQLRIIFMPDLKILSWEFCVRRHEEFFPRRLVAPQVSQLLQVTKKYQTAVIESGSEGISPKELQTSCDMFLATGRQIARNLEPQSLNNLGFSKSSARFLQISEVLHSMKDLMDISQEHKIGPIESLKKYSQQAPVGHQTETKTQEVEKTMTLPSLPADQSTSNKTTETQPGLGRLEPDNQKAACIMIKATMTGPSLAADQNTSNKTTETQRGIGRLETDSQKGTCIMSNAPPAPAVVPSEKYHHPMSAAANPDQNKLQPNASYTFSSAVNGLSGPNQQTSLSNSTLSWQNNSMQFFQVNQHIKEHAVGQLKGAPKQSLGASNGTGNIETEATISRGVGDAGGLAATVNPGPVVNNLSSGNITTNTPNNITTGTLALSNKFVASDDSSSNMNSIVESPDLPPIEGLPELDDDFLQEFVGDWDFQW